MGRRLGKRNEVIIGRRYGQLAGLAAFVLVLGRLGRLLQTGPTTPRWQLILISAAFLGGVVWWLIRQMVVTHWLALTLFGLGSATLFLRISVPNSLIAGIAPSPETPTALVNALDQAIAQIRFGIAPIEPSAGVIAVLALVVWIVGALFTWGVTNGPTAAMVIPSIVIYLQFAIFDRTPAGLGWMTASAAMLALAVSALALERKADTGRVRDSEGRPIPIRSVTAATVMALIVGVAATAAGTNAANIVSEYGNLPWTSGKGGGFGPGGSGFALDRFVDLRQNIISRDNLLLFEVTFGDGAPQLEQIYWRLETLDSFDGIAWRPSSGNPQNYEPGRQIGHESNVYQGSTTEYTHRVHIEELRQQVAPTGGVPTALIDINIPGAIRPSEFQHTEDATLLYNQVLREKDVYEVTVSYPLQTADQGALATGFDGRLSPIFASAAEDGVFSDSPSLPQNEVATPRDLDALTDLPENTPTQVRTTALTRTLGATTDYEKAWLLQYWFRDSGEFNYSTNVTTGFTSLDLDEWLNEPLSTNYRTGYCEQFALSMAVLGRSLGIPSRVVLGFTPGTSRVVESEEGEPDTVVDVRDTNAHAWVEMWMDGFGWVQFDPTPRNLAEPADRQFQTESITAGFDPLEYTPVLGADGAPIDRPADSSSEFSEERFDDPQATADQGPRWWLLVILVVVLLLLVSPVAKSIRWRRRFKAANNGDVTAVWDELVDRLSDLGNPVPPSQTPMEFADNTDPALLKLAVAYSAAIYGGRTQQSAELSLMEIDHWLTTTYSGSDRALAKVNPRSLINRD